MVLLEGLEKLINEHGSAVILKERIALANDRYADLERTNEGLRTDIASLKAERAELKEEARRLRAELDEAKTKVQNGGFSQTKLVRG